MSDSHGAQSGERKCVDSFPNWAPGCPGLPAIGCRETDLIDKKSIRCYRAVTCALSLWACMGLAPRCALAQASKGEVCPRPPAGSAVPEPEDLRSQNGVLRVELTFLNFRDPRGQARYC